MWSMRALRRKGVAPPTTLLVASQLGEGFALPPILWFLELFM
jgi:hypothetical protein